MPVSASSAYTPAYCQPGVFWIMPLYWLMISLAAWKGLWQIFTKPFYWEKTRHGLTGQPEGGQET